MSKPSRTMINGPKTHTIEYGLFISVAAIIAIATLDAAGGTVNTMFTLVADAMNVAASS